VSGARASTLRGLYAITPAKRETRALVALARACVEGGARIVQYRFKDVAPSIASEQAAAIAHVCREHGAIFIVNDSLELARAVDADGVHLGREDGDPRAARRAWPEAVIGVSCYADPALAREAAAAGADYVGIGSVFPSPTKPAAIHAPLPLLAQARELSGLPVAAIGGITLDNARAAIEAGADMVAVITALFDAPDVGAAARAFASLFAAPIAGAPHVRA
jgi:thiamine-phosphate pyrophosphorylase